MAENKKDKLNTPELTAEEKVEQGIPVDSSEAVIEEAAPPEAFAEKGPADVAPEERGQEALGAANRYKNLEDGMNATTGADPAAKKPIMSDDFRDKYWKPYLWPIATLVAICIIVSVLLGVTNAITLPIIEQNADKASQQARLELLPAATGFEEVEIPEGYEGVTSMYRATNDVGYVVEGYSQGYGGLVSAMVAFDMDGTIAGVQFPDNDETPGLGQKISTYAPFAAQFNGKSGQLSGADVDKIASATISTNAAVAAVNNATNLFQAEVLGNVAEDLTEEEMRERLLPDATDITEVSVSISGVKEAWAGNDGGAIITATASGFYGDPVTAMVGIDASGAITGVYLDTSNETKGFGMEVMDNTAFRASFEGLTSPDGVDGVAGATVTSTAVFEAVQTALDAFETVKGAA